MYIYKYTMGRMYIYTMLVRSSTHKWLVVLHYRTIVRGSGEGGGSELLPYLVGRTALREVGDLGAEEAVI
jgi:hypothetical protein